MTSTPTLSPEQVTKRDDLIRRIRNSEGGNVGVGRLLNQIVEERLYRDTCPNMGSFVEETIGIADSTASRWQAAARHVDSFLARLHPAGVSADHDQVRSALERIQSDSALGSIRQKDFPRQIIVCLEAIKVAGAKKLQPKHVAEALKRLGLPGPEENKPASITVSDLAYVREEVANAVEILSVCEDLLKRDARRLARRLAAILVALGDASLVDAHGQLREKKEKAPAPLDEPSQDHLKAREGICHG